MFRKFAALSTAIAACALAACGGGMGKLGEDVTEVLDYVPGHFQVIRHVREQPALRELPILVMTGKNLTKDEIALLLRETQGLLQKDGSWKQQLIAEVDRVIRGHKRAKSAGQS